MKIKNLIESPLYQIIIAQLDFIEIKIRENSKKNLK
jgi:hypothetical protein